MEDLNPIRRWFAEWRTRWHNINGTAVLRLGDAAGESRLSIRNSDDEEVFYFASNGTSNIEPIDGEEGQALLRGGDRSLIGNLVVATGVTVDGVDISSFSADTASWQSAHTASGQHDVLHIGADVEIRRAGANVAALGTGDSLQSSSFSSGAYGYRLGDDGNAEFNNIRARGEFAASVFRRSEISAAAGTLGVFPGASVVHVDFTTPGSVGSDVSAFIRNETPASGTASFSGEDILQVKTWNGTAFVNAYLKVSASPAPVVSTGYTKYLLLLMNGSVNAAVAAGTAIVKTGTSSGGAALLLSADGSVGGAPNMTMQTHTGVPWEPTVISRFGNLSGITDSVFGALSGYGTYVAGNAYVTGAINASGGQISGVLGIGASGGIYQGTGTFGTPTTGLKIWNDSGVGRIGGYDTGVLQWYANSDGTLKAGGGDVTLDSDGISLVSWLSSRGSLGSVNGYRFSATSTTFCGLYAYTNSTVQTNVQLLNYGVTQPEITIEAQDTATTGGSYSAVTITASGPSYSASARLDANVINLYGKGLRVTSAYDATAAAAGTLYTSGSATVSGGLNVGSATGAATGEIKASAGISATTGTFSGALSATTGTFSGNISATATNSPTLTLKSTASGGGSRSFFKMESQSAGDYFLAAYMADASPRRMQWYYGSDGSSSAVPVLSMTSANRVGVNVSAPGYTLDVDVNVRFTEGLNVGSATSADTGQIFAAGSAANSNQKVLDIRNNASASGLTLRTVSVSMYGVNEDARIVAGNETSGSGATGFLALYTRTSDALGAQEKVRISAAGRVGIGKSAPGYLLDVDGSGRMDTSLIVGGDIGSGLASHVTFTNANNVAANSTGAGTIKFKSATSRDSSGFIKIYVGTTAYWVPFFSAVT